MEHPEIEEDGRMVSVGGRGSGAARSRWSGKGRPGEGGREETTAAVERGFVLVVKLHTFLVEAHVG